MGRRGPGELFAVRKNAGCCPDFCLLQEQFSFIMSSLVIHFNQRSYVTVVANRKVDPPDTELAFWESSVHETS